MTNTPIKVNRGTSIAFVIAAAIYLIGVFVISFWCHVQQSKQLRTYIESSETTYTPKKIEAALKITKTRNIALGIILVVLAFPIMFLGCHICFRTTKQLNIQIRNMNQNMNTRKKHEANQQDAVHDLERLTNMALSRESRILELKAEVNELLNNQNEKPRYQSDQTKDSAS